MKIAVTICRILLGVTFVVLGLNGFLLFMPPPPANSMPHDAVAFSTLLFSSHYMYVTAGTQVLCGILLLLNRYTGFALLALAAVLVNVLTFHATMWPQTLFPLPVLTVVFFVVTAWPLRERFARLFAARV